MSRVLLDTNVISELVRQRPEPQVVEFVRAQTDPLISVLTLHEITYGAERAPDPARQARLVAWAAEIRSQFGGRIVDIDAEVAETAGRLRAAADAQGSPADIVDALIAACALARGAAIVTRNVRDFVPFGLTVVDPWAAPG
ncbi:MAG: type II toxin-antitoxin system VapC family toxin [Hyphomonadaceae bacterium]|nr:MAG: PilT protein domain-containing protein [Caulobacteraceae bacterium]MBT9445870.1 type II toxin-antitoxin system VapC family toxin [Hyphomonadaceae bacterium]TPW08533.1 MAG: PilT protein domain-containing protein [Alphaproteobacteria bacterium]